MNTPVAQYFVICEVETAEQQAPARTSQLRSSLFESHSSGHVFGFIAIATVEANRGVKPRLLQSGPHLDTLP